MKKEFSTKWRSSKLPRKQRKYVANAPLHLRKNLMTVTLSKDLRKKHEKRNIPLRKGDTVKIIKGKFKGKQGKVNEIKLKQRKIFVDGIQVTKQDKSKANVKLQPANLVIVELNLEDKKRLKQNQVKENKEIKK